MLTKVKFLAARILRTSHWSPTLGATVTAIGFDFVGLPAKLSSVLLRVGRRIDDTTQHNTTHIQHFTTT